MAPSVDAGRDVQTDLLGWQKQALGQATQFAIRQGFRRHHPNRSLSDFSKTITNGKHPRLGWERAMAEEQKRTRIPEVYKKLKHLDATPNQYGLVETAFKNYSKSRARLGAINMVGI